MHPNPVFRDRAEADSLALAAARGFGTLAVSADVGPLLAHVPFLLDAAGGHADLHLVRSNPIVRQLEAPRPAVIAVAGPDGYVSPDWYGVPDQVPTWNYVAVHLRGMLERLPDDALRPLLDRQSAAFEARLAPKPAWMPAKMDAAALDRMMRMIVPMRLRLEKVDSTWKLSQNKPAPVRLSAAEQMERSAFGQDTAGLAGLMRDLD